MTTDCSYTEYTAGYQGDLFDQPMLPAWKTLIRQKISPALIFKINEAYRNEHAKGYRIFPAPADTFRIFNLTEPDKIKAVILGQDPYHALGQADGLAFSVRNGAPPPSLKNIFREIEADTGKPVVCRDGNLKGWAKQGVFLLNTLLSVREKEPLSHARIGWEEFTDQVIQIIQELNAGVIFLLWGNAARKKKGLIDTARHRIIETSHPSPLGYHKGFKNSGQFKDVADLLAGLEKTAIQW